MQLGQLHTQDDATCSTRTITYTRRLLVQLEHSHTQDVDYLFNSNNYIILFCRHCDIYILFIIQTCPINCLIRNITVLLITYLLDSLSLTNLVFPKDGELRGVRRVSHSALRVYSDAFSV